MDRDDTRAALYGKAVEILRVSPIVGIGLGQAMVAAETKFPELLAGEGLENLHAHWANFAAMGRLLGFVGLSSAAGCAHAIIG